MNKNETIISVMEAFDEAERYKRERDQLRGRVMGYQLKEEGYEFSEQRPRWFMDIYGYGRDALWKEYGERKYYNMRVDVTENDDGTKRVESFEHWAKDNYTDFPDFMSRDDFMEEYEEEMRERYEKERAEALKEE